MDFETFKEEVDKNIDSLFNKANNDEKMLLNRMINTINELCKEKQELIDYLKGEIKQCEELITQHKECIKGVVNISDNNRHIILIRQLKIEKDTYQEILSKIEKSKYEN